MNNSNAQRTQFILTYPGKRKNAAKAWERIQRKARGKLIRDQRKMSRFASLLKCIGKVKQLFVKN